ncbi:hypothetical protein BBP00_00003953 [Phytophthora kernoviae]|uniref:1-phosphatidylinositol 4-kinase n=1 Tax=Phytophthora kernoviae TaxID=325452 RepID=A0A3F2RT18_9STRA|nr:hypothetical protein BBP00_00003953 [Phytophthora kernoviae]
MDKLAVNLAKNEDSTAALEQEQDLFHLLLKLYAHQDVVEELYSSYEANAEEFQFYIPQLCTFLLHGNYDKQHQLECFLMSRSGEALPFAHRLTWFLRSFCDDAKEYQSEYLSVTASPDQENSDLLSAIGMRAGVPALLMNNGLCAEEVSATKPDNLERRRTPAFPMDKEIDPTTLETDESFSGHLLNKRNSMQDEARMDEGNAQQITLFKQTPKFVEALTDLAEQLIPTPRPRRNSNLRKGLSEIHEKMLPSNVIYLPIGNSCHRVKGIHVDECFTFSTKERVPYFLCVEVLDYSVTSPATASKKRRRRRSRTSRNQSRVFSLKLPFKKNGMSEAETMVTPDDSPMANSYSSESELNLEGLLDSDMQVSGEFPSDSEQVEGELSPTASPLADIEEEKTLERLDSMTQVQDAAGAAEDDLLDGEVGDDEKEENEQEPRKSLLEDEDLQRATEEQQERMGQWGLPRTRRHSIKEYSSSASARSGGQFDSFYSSWFSKKTLRESDEAFGSAESQVSEVDEAKILQGNDTTLPASVNNAATGVTNEIPAEKGDTAVVAVMGASTIIETDNVASSKYVAGGADTIPSSESSAPVVDQKLSEDESVLIMRRRDLSVSLDFADPSAWKDKFDLEDGLSDDEPDAEATDAVEESAKEETDAPDSDDEKPMIVFRERWSEKEARIRRESPFGDHPGWRLLSVIVKSNDDLRQEQFAAQLIAQCDRIFREYSLPLALRPYNVIATSAKTGLIEAVPDTVSLDSLKRNDPGYTTLLDFYHRLHGDKNTTGFTRAQRNFVESLAAYSIVCYVFQIKDRHNGNILLDTDGHVIHIDFGFLLTNSPGSNWNFERAPFKLTDEFVELMGGPRSSTFRYFRSLCIRAYLALRRNMDQIVLLVEMMLVGNDDLPCFAGGKKAVIEGLRARLKPGARTSTCQVFVNQLIDQSINNWRTRWYDKYQRACLGIL